MNAREFRHTRRYLLRGGLLGSWRPRFWARVGSLLLRLTQTTPARPTTAPLLARPPLVQRLTMLTTKLRDRFAPVYAAYETAMKRAKSTG
jgi:hypothetical protein